MIFAFTQIAYRFRFGADEPPAATTVDWATRTRQPFAGTTGCPFAPSLTSTEIRYFNK